MARPPTRGRLRCFWRHAAPTRRRPSRLAEDELRERQDVFTLDAHAWALAASGQHRAGARGHGTRGRPRARRTAVSSSTRAVIDAAAGRPGEAAALARRRQSTLRAMLLPSESAELSPTADRTPSMRRVDMKKSPYRVLPIIAAGGFLLAGPSAARASSHMDAPLITLDDAANTTDVYAFVRERERQQDARDRSRRLPVRGAGHRPEQVQLRRRTCSTRSTWRPATTWRPGARRSRTSSSFTTRFKNTKTILQSYLGVDQERGRRGAEPDAVLHRHAGRPPDRSPHACSAGASFRRTIRATPRPSTTRATTARTRARTASPRTTSSIATRSSRSPRSTAATSRSRASATTASTATSRRSSIC